MDNIADLEKCYKCYINNLSLWLPEGVIHVDLELLHKFDLLHYYDLDHYNPGLTRYFHVIETREKITLINELFIVWIVPEMVHEIPITYTLIALNQSTAPKLELAFATSGIYNSSKLVLHVLEKFLFEIQENEELLNSYRSA